MERRIFSENVERKSRWRVVGGIILSLLSALGIGAAAHEWKGSFEFLSTADTLQIRFEAGAVSKPKPQ